MLQGYLLMYIKINIGCMTLCIHYARHTTEEEVQQDQKVTNNARFLYLDPNSIRSWFSPSEKQWHGYDDQKDAICAVCGPC